MAPKKNKTNKKSDEGVTAGGGPNVSRVNQSPYEVSELDPVNQGGLFKGAVLRDDPSNTNFSATRGGNTSTAVDNERAFDHTCQTAREHIKAQNGGRFPAVNVSVFRSSPGLRPHKDGSSKIEAFGNQRYNAFFCFLSPLYFLSPLFPVTTVSIMDANKLKAIQYSKNLPATKEREEFIAAYKSPGVRIASEMDVKLGEKVGYGVRFDDVEREDCIEVRNNLSASAEVLSDRKMAKYSYVIIDEANKRTLAAGILYTTPGPGQRVTTIDLLQNVNDRVEHLNSQIKDLNDKVDAMASMLATRIDDAAVNRDTVERMAADYGDLTYTGHVLRSLFNHIVLPVKPPQRQYPDLGETGSALVDCLVGEYKIIVMGARSALRLQASSPYSTAAHELRSRCKRTKRVSRLRLGGGDSYMWPSPTQL
ncbi:hypothetical protein DL765_011630 [Monosporascus sp. GIB2]|nr:hypothetical protein DL765_011630 [Monosporascus sp. GIB2]